MTSPAKLIAVFGVGAALCLGLVVVLARPSDPVPSTDSLGVPMANQAMPEDPEDLGPITSKASLIPVAPFNPFKFKVGAENPSVWVNMLSFEAFYMAHLGPSDGPFAKLRMANLLIAGHRAAALEAAKAKEANNPWGKVIGEPAERWLSAHAKEVGAATLDAWRESERLALANHVDPQSNLCEGYGQVEQVDGWRATVHFQPAMGRPFIRVMVWREIPQNQ